MDNKRLSLIAADVLRESRLIVKSVDRRQWIEGTFWLILEAVFCLGFFLLPRM